MVPSLVLEVRREETPHHSLQRRLGRTGFEQGVKLDQPELMLDLESSPNG
jgi:hypothetical protein